MEGGQLGVRSIMNIFHKLDIHYPGTDIRAEAPGSWLGEGAALSFLPAAPLQPRVSMHLREPSLPTALWWVVGVSQPHLSLARELIPLTLKLLLLSAAPAGVRGLEVCARKEEAWPAQDPRTVGTTGPSLRYRRGQGTGRGKPQDSHLLPKALMGRKHGSGLVSHAGKQVRSDLLQSSPEPGLRHPFPGGALSKGIRA